MDALKISPINSNIYKDEYQIYGIILCMIKIMRCGFCLAGSHQCLAEWFPSYLLSMGNIKNSLAAKQAQTVKGEYYGWKKGSGKWCCGIHCIANYLDNIVYLIPAARCPYRIAWR
jgi:hypothetical protein